jgi:hypothetical protein
MTLRLNLGLRRDFTWRFMVADVTHPLIGADFLSHFGLLVDCRNNRLLDGTTLSAPIQAPSSPIPSVKGRSGGTPVDSRRSGSSASEQAAPPAHGPTETSSGSSPSQPSFIRAQGPPQLRPCLPPSDRNAPGSGAPLQRSLSGSVSEGESAVAPSERQTCHCVCRLSQASLQGSHFRCSTSSGAADFTHVDSCYPDYKLRSPRPLPCTPHHLGTSLRGGGGGVGTPHMIDSWRTSEAK